MLLSAVSSVLILLATVTLAAPHTSGDATIRLSKRVKKQCPLLQYQIKGKKPSSHSAIISKCLSEYTLDLDKSLYDMARGTADQQPANDRSMDEGSDTMEFAFKPPTIHHTDEWPAISKAYAAKQADFEWAISQAYPEMIEHLNRVHHVILKPSFYEFQNFQVEGTVRVINLLEAEIARAMWKRETTARFHRDKGQVKELNHEILNLLQIWFSEGRASFSSPSLFTGDSLLIPPTSQPHFFPTQERAAVYGELLIAVGTTPWTFVFYAPTKKFQGSELESYIQANLGQYLQPERFLTEDQKMIRHLDKALRDMAQRMLDQVFADDEYAKYHELFQALFIRNNLAEETRNVLWPESYDVVTHKPGPGRLNFLEAEFSRLWALMPPKGDYTAIYTYIGFMNVIDAWNAGVKAQKFFPSEQRKQWFSGQRDDMVEILSYCQVKDVPPELQADFVRILEENRVQN